MPEERASGNLLIIALGEGGSNSGNWMDFTRSNITKGWIVKSTAKVGGSATFLKYISRFFSFCFLWDSQHRYARFW